MVKSLKLEGQDLGVILGYDCGIAPGGVFLYKPVNDLAPTSDMSGAELEACLTPKTLYVNISYAAVKQVDVDGNTVWRNRDSFDLKSMGIHPFDQSYRGRGNVIVEFRTDIDGVDDLVNKILERKIWLHKTE